MIEQARNACRAAGFFVVKGFPWQRKSAMVAVFRCPTTLQTRRFGTPRVFASQTSLDGAGSTVAAAASTAAVCACSIQDECQRASMFE
ncbi:hypothetical protein UF78_04680 [Stutzerimonas stutzeri]|uniref:Uncharacterized protein n=1 Tax=Stutzerimonas stutzeri TaxID=316 RepID=A0A0D9AVG4_STUST|nr:hypothetical protein UF78_04680 [Stutzerimonas stutzeri]